MTARVQRLGPGLLLHVPAAAAEETGERPGGGVPPHALAADLVIEGVGKGGGG